MDTSKTQAPVLKDLNIDNITENTIIINSQGNDPRLKYVMERLVTHLHDFARETRLSTSEWMAALNFLVGVGQISSDVRHVYSPFHTTSLLLGLKHINTHEVLFSRSSSFCQIFWVSHSWSMQLTIQNPALPLRVPCLVHSTHMRQRPYLTVK
jgi:hypothetical protein